MAADGTIRIIIDVDGKQVEVASTSLENLESAGHRAGQGAGEAEEGIKRVGKESKGAAGSIKTFATSLGLVEIGKAAFRTLASSMDAAISRFDTLNKFPKVLQGLGVSAEDSKRAMDNLSEGISGLPTLLNEISVTAQRMYTSFNDIDKATDTALGLNNALLASGASAGDAQRGTEQYLKILQTGKVDMQTWTSLQQTMSLGLVKVSEAFGMTEQEMYSALKSGSVSIDEFNDKLIELGTGTGLLADLARENTLGIATSFGNLKVAAARGLTHIIEKVDELSKELTGKDIAQNIDSMKVIVFKAFTVVGSVIEKTTPIVKGFATGVSAATSVVKVLSPAIMGLMAAYAAYTVIAKTTAAIQGANKILVIAQASQHALTIAVKAQTAAQAEQTGMIGLSTAAIGLLTGKLTVAKVATAAQTAATKALAAAKAALSGPIGWVVLGVGLLTAGTIAVVKWFKKATEESNRLNSETEKLGEATDALVDSVDSSSRAYEENQKSAKATAEGNKALAKEIDNLIGKENKSAAEKMILRDKVEQLNSSVEGLNVTYNEEADALSMSSEEIQARVKLLENQTSYNDALQRQTEIKKEQNEIDLQLGEINDLREEWNQKLEEGSVKGREHKKALKELDEKEQQLKETNAELGEQYQETQEQIVESAEAVTKAIQDGVANQTIALEDLSESQQATVESMKSTWEEYKDAATDMFDTLDDKIKITASKMADNLEENQRIITKWSENIATLANRGLDEGLLEELRKAGPKSAGHVNALVKASDEELERLSTAFAQGGEVATKALNKSLGLEESGVLDSVEHLITGTEESLKQQIEAAGFSQLGIDVSEGYAGGIEEGTPKAEEAATELADKTIKAAEDTLETHSPSKVFVDIGDSVTDGLSLGIDNGTEKVIQAMGQLLKDILASFDSINSDFKGIGENAMAGFNSGLNNRKGQVLTTARNIANQAAIAMRNALKVQSPSKVTTEIGEQSGQGLADGLENKEKEVSAASLKMANAVTAIIASLHSDVTNETDKHNKEIAQIEKRAKEDIYLIEKKATDAKRKLTEQEKIKIQRITEDANKKIINLEEKAAKEREKIAENNSKTLIETAEKYVSDMKFWQGMSLREEAEYWYQMYAALEVGTEEYESALKNHQAVVKRFRDEMERTNENYAKRMLDIDKNLANETKRLQDNYTKTSKNIRETLSNDIEKVQADFEKASENIRKKLTDDIDRLNKEYENAYSNRVSELTNVTGLFEAFTKKSSVPGEYLLRNLETQVQALEEYSTVMGSLDKRIKNKDLMAELQKLGPNSLAELQALNRMSDSQLAEYVALYEKKFKLASKQASKELEPMKKETQSQIRDLNRIAERELEELQRQTQKQMRRLNRIAERELEQLQRQTETQIEELNRIAQNELETVEREWIQKINDIVHGTKEEFDQLYFVGVDAIQGLESGILSQESSLMATARRIADSVSSTIKSALEIRSPSRLMKDKIGKMIPAGLALGIEENAKLVYQELEKMSNNIMKISTPEVALGTSGMALARPNYSASGYSGSIRQHQHQVDGVIRVEGVNNQGELVGVVDIMKDELRRGARL